jgi:hypothetical protein
VEAGQPHVLDVLPSGHCLYCVPIVNWYTHRNDFKLFEEEYGGSFEVIVPVVPIEDGDTTGADQEADDDERDAEPQLTANDHDDAGDHQDDGD